MSRIINGIYPSLAAALSPEAGVCFHHCCLEWEVWGVLASSAARQLSNKSIELIT